MPVSYQPVTSYPTASSVLISESYFNSIPSYMRTNNCATTSAKGFRHRKCIWNKAASIYFEICAKKKLVLHLRDNRVRRRHEPWSKTSTGRRGLLSTLIQAQENTVLDLRYAWRSQVNLSYNRHAQDSKVLYPVGQRAPCSTHWPPFYFPIATSK